MQNPTFVEVYPQVFNKDTCNAFIENFEALNDMKMTYNRQETESTEKTIKNDKSFSTGEVVWIEEADVKGMYKDLVTTLNETLYKEAEKYVDKYDIIKNNEQISIYVHKMQKTKVGGGYHVWHCEAGSRGTADRVLTYVIYLNDVDEGGETEFLYQNLRQKPKAGDLVIFPAGFTHPHRGNPPISNDKYILTGWWEF